MRRGFSLAGRIARLIGSATVYLLLSATLQSGFANPVESADRPGFDFRDGASRDPSVPAPPAVLGLEMGNRPVRHGEVIRYLESLAETSPRVKLVDYGKTHENRSLIYAVIALPEHLSRLDEIMADRDCLADPGCPWSDGVAETPAVAWLGYSIHGTELSSTDAALQLAYELAAGRDDTILDILRNVIVLIDPLQNPDGRERYLSQIEFLNGIVPNPDPASLNHTAFWPWGRSNHYLFDLNRDWFAQVHPESQARVAVIRRWKPQLVMDAHEMKSSSTYLFPPARDPLNPHLDPRQLSWIERFSRDQAAAFDHRGWSYYTREWNEEWYPGYGSSWPLYRGAVGILNEQSRTEGRVVRRPDGSTVTYREAVHHQLVSSLVNLQTLAENRGEILRDFREIRSDAVQRGGQGPFRAFLFAPVPNAERLSRFAQNLTNQGIQVLRAAAEFRATDLHDAWGEEWKSKDLPAGTRMVRLDQPLEPLIRATLEFHTQMADSFLASEREELEIHDQTRIYDVTAWSLPIAYGIESYWTGRIPQATWEVEGEPGPEEGGLRGEWPAYGIVAAENQERLHAAAAKLMEAGLAVRVAEEPFRLEGSDYGAGSLLLVRETNPDSLVDVVRRVAAETRTHFQAVRTARAESGPDLGGGKFRPLIEPRIAILAGNPTYTGEYGSLWHLFDHEMRIRVSSLDVSRVGDTDLSRYNVLIMPSVREGPDSYRRVLGAEGVESIGTWVKNGGTLIGLHVGAAFLADTTTGLSQVRLRRQSLEKYRSPECGVPYKAARQLFMAEAMGFDDEGAPLAVPGSFGVPGPGDPVLGPGAIAFAPAAGKRVGALRCAKSLQEDDGASTAADLDPELLARIDERLRRFRPRGVILRVDLDPRRWLAFGMPDRIPFMLSTSFAYLAQSPVHVVGRFADYDDLQVSGLLWPEAAGRWARTACVTRESVGRGQVILFAGNPAFRGYWLGTRRLLMNAAVFGPGMGTSTNPPYSSE